MFPSFAPIRAKPQPREASPKQPCEICSFSFRDGAENSPFGRAGRSLFKGQEFVQTDCCNHWMETNGRSSLPGRARSKGSYRFLVSSLSNCTRCVGFSFTRAMISLERTFIA